MKVQLKMKVLSCGQHLLQYKLLETFFGHQGQVTQSLYSDLAQIQTQQISYACTCIVQVWQWSDQKWRCCLGDIFQYARASNSNINGPSWTKLVHDFACFGWRKLQRKLNMLGWIHVLHFKYIGKCWHSKERNFKADSLKWPEFEFIMFDEDSMKNENASLETPVSPLEVKGSFWLPW